MNFAIGESGGRRLEQFERRLADRHEVRPDALRGHLLGRLDVQAERVAVERQGLREVAHGDADVIQCRFHDVLVLPRARSRMPSAAV